MEDLEYQDSRGFVIHGHHLYQTIADTMAQAALSSILPPSTPMMESDRAIALVEAIELRTQKVLK